MENRAALNQTVRNVPAEASTRTNASPILNRNIPDVSVDLELLRRKLLFVEEAFFAMAERDGALGEKTSGLGYIVGDLADQVQAIYDKLYGGVEDGPSGGSGPCPGNGRRQ
jgi:hypothetical protein